jgi:signal transduction histidine kinase
MQNQPADQHVLTLRVCSAPSGGVRLSIIDTGSGIAPESSAHLFTYGFTTKCGGHGFALHHAMLTARKMGGTIQLMSAGPGRGTTCSLDLPATDAPPAMLQP